MPKTTTRANEEPLINCVLHNPISWLIISTIEIAAALLQMLFRMKAHTWFLVCGAFSRLLVWSGVSLATGPIGVG